MIFAVHLIIFAVHLRSGPCKALCSIIGIGLYSYKTLTKWHLILKFLLWPHLLSDHKSVAFLIKQV